MAFKDTLKQLRTQKSLTQKQLAEITNLSQNAISMYESGRREPDMRTLSALAQALDTDMNHLLETEAKESMPQQPKEELNPRDQRDIGKKLRSMLELFDSDEALMFDGEPLDAETRELLKESYRNQLELTKRIAKAKYSPRKNRK